MSSSAAGPTSRRARASDAQVRPYPEPSNAARRARAGEGPKPKPSATSRRIETSARKGGAPPRERDACACARCVLRRVLQRSPGMLTCTSREARLCTRPFPCLVCLRARRAEGWAGALPQMWAGALPDVACMVLPCCHVARMPDASGDASGWPRGEMRCHTAGSRHAHASGSAGVGCCVHRAWRRKDRYAVACAIYGAWWLVHGAVATDCVCVVANSWLRLAGPQRTGVS